MSQPAMELSFAPAYKQEQFEDVAESLRKDGSVVGLKQRPKEGPYAFLEVLIPTALILWVFKPYLESFSTESGKLHADALQTGLGKLWHKVFGPTPEVDWHIFNASGEVKPEVFSPGVSVKVARKDGGELILLFPPKTSEADFSAAVNRLMELMAKHFASDGDDPLTKAMAEVPYLDSPNWNAVVYMNPETKSLELVDYVESSRNQKLISYKIAA